MRFTRIFETLHQVDRDKLEQQGCGLGLAVVRGLVEQCGGRVTVRSEPDNGTRFTVSLLLADKSRWSEASARTSSAARARASAP